MYSTYPKNMICFLDSICVDESLREEGLGRMLYGALEEKMIAEGLQEIRARVVFPEEVEAESFLEAIGFDRLAEGELYYDIPLAELVLLLSRVKDRTMLDDGQSVCCGTKDSLKKGDVSAPAGEAVDDGMVGTHAYSILGAKETKDGIRMIALRNPFGSYTADYKLNKKGDLEVIADNTDTNGIFWVEINHFMKYVNQIYGSGKPEPNEPNEE